MSDLFVIEDGVAKPIPEILLIRPFKQIWQRDDSVGHIIALNEFSYIEFYCSFKKSNPYSGYEDDQERHEKIVEGLFEGIDWKPDILIEEAIFKYNDFQNNASVSLKYFKSVRSALNTLREYWDTLDMTKLTRTGMLVNKPSDVARGIEQTSSLLVKLADLEVKVQQELLSDSRTRGNRIINYFEK